MHAEEEMLVEDVENYYGMEEEAAKKLADERVKQIEDEKKTKTPLQRL